MTQAKRAPLPKFVTPAGVALYPYLIEPDTKFNPDGEYRLKLRVPADQSTALIEKLEGIRDEYRKTLEPKVQKTFKTEEVFEKELDDNGDETGNVIFKFKLKAKVTPKQGKPFTQRPSLFDSVKNDITGKLDALWSGSVLKISGEVAAYSNPTNKSIGLSLRPRGVQILKLVKGGQRDADSYGFGEEEGFSADLAGSAPPVGGDDSVAGDDDEF